MKKKIKVLITRYNSILRYDYFEIINFYGSPKIHKSEILHKAIKEQNKELITISKPKGLKP